MKESEKPTSAPLIAPADIIPPVPLLDHVRVFYIVRCHSPTTHSSQPTYTINELHKRKRKRTKRRIDQKTKTKHTNKRERKRKEKKQSHTNTQITKHKHTIYITRFFYYLGWVFETQERKKHRSLIIVTIQISQSTPNIQVHPLQNNFQVSKVHCKSVFNPGASGLPYYCTSICVRSWCNLRASLWILNQNKKNTGVRMAGRLGIHEGG